MTYKRVLRASGYFAGKKILIIGAANGIGKAICVSALKQGAVVCAADIDSSGLSTLINQCAKLESKVHRFDCDLRVTGTATEVVQNAATLMKGLDVVITSIGALSLTKLKSDAQIAETISVNLTATLQTIHAALREAGRDKHLTLVPISSLAACRAPGRFFDYAASKAGLDSAIRAIKTDCGSNIRVVHVSPGFVDTRLISEFKFRPFCVSTDYAAEKIMTAIERGKSRCVFHWQAGLIAWLSRWAPNVLVRLIARSGFDNF